MWVPCVQRRSMPKTIWNFHVSTLCTKQEQNLSLHIHWWWGLLSSFIVWRGCCWRVSFWCTGGARIHFAMKLPDGVIVDKTIADQVIFHHAIFVDKIVLASIARTNGALPTQTCTMLFTTATNFVTWCRKVRSLPALSTLYIHSALYMKRSCTQRETRVRSIQIWFSLSCI